MRLFSSVAAVATLALTGPALAQTPAAPAPAQTQAQTQTQAPAQATPSAPADEDDASEAARHWVANTPIVSLHFPWVM